MKKRTALRFGLLLIVTYAIIFTSVAYLWNSYQKEKSKATTTLSEANASDNVNFGGRDRIITDEEKKKEKPNEEKIASVGAEDSTSMDSETTVRNDSSQSILDKSIGIEKEFGDMVQEDVDRNIKMSFTGDVYIGNYVSHVYKRQGIAGVLTTSLQKILIDSDFTLINQEFPFSLRGTPMPKKQYTFRVDPKKVSLFQDMGADMVSLANNHTLDYGVDALIDTLDTLQNANIVYGGVGKDLEEAKTTRYFEIQGKKIAILCASRVLPVAEWAATDRSVGIFSAYNPTTLVEEIKIANEQADIVVVYLHWGLERREHPEAYQRADGKAFIDAGADLVIGSHPHVLQGIEYYKNRPIVYSLGNFIFSQTIKQTALLQVEVDEKNEIALQLLPCETVNGKTQELTNPEEIKKFYEYMSSISYHARMDSNGKVIKEE